MKDLSILNQRNFLTTKELCVYVYDQQISVTTLNVLVKEGKIPSVRVGRKNLIPVSFAREQLQINEGGMR